MSIELARRVFCRVAGTPMEAVALRARSDPGAATGVVGTGQLYIPGPGVPWAGAVGLGLGDLSGEAIVRGVLDFFEPRGIEPELVICPYVRRDLLMALAAAGFRAFDFRHLLVADAASAQLEMPPDVEVRVGGVEGVIARGFQDGADPPPAMLGVEQMFDAQPSATTFTGFVDGVPAGGGRVGIADGVALLFGASVLPEARRRGVQQALLRARMAHALEAGCDLLVVESTAGGPTERNAMRAGFRVAFTNTAFKR